MREKRGYHMLGRRNVVLGAGSLLVGCAGMTNDERARTASGRAGPHDAADLGARGAVPEARWGVQSGEVSASRAVVWSRADRPSRMVAEWSTNEAFGTFHRAGFAEATLEHDLTARLALDGLPPGTRIHYRVRFETSGASEWARGSLVTPVADEAPPQDVVFAWSGDVNGQGWGIDVKRGGMPAYKALLDRAPDFYVSCGDAIYADNPILPTVDVPGGSPWENFVLPAKTNVAVTLDDYRGAFLYPRHSAEVRAASAAVASFSIWDDHEVRNNWFPGEVLEDPRYAKERHIDMIAANARRAMLEHAPVLDPSKPLYRRFRWGPLLEVFLLDGRTFRTPNEPRPDRESFLGAEQLAWLERGLTTSKATWKVIASDMPVGLVVSEPAVKGECAPGYAGPTPRGRCEAYDGFANTNGPPSGRELELARLFTTLAKRGVANLVFLTADVHYAAAHRYSPERAVHKEMPAFWEFVAGPMHATAFPKKGLDDTFGPEVVYVSADDRSVGYPSDPKTQSFGVIRIDAASRVMTVTLVDGRGRDLHVAVLRPERRGP